jgi:hypothetical protein
MFSLGLLFMVLVGGVVACSGNGGRSRLSQCRYIGHYCWNIHHHRDGHLGCDHEDRNCHRDGAVGEDTARTFRCCFVSQVTRPHEPGHPCSGRITGNPESAGLNRHVVGDARALQERK